jgi:hypothetical protein
VLLAEHVMNKRDSNRSFTDRRRDSLDVAAAHVSNRKNAGAAGFEQIRRSCCGHFAFASSSDEIRPRFHEALLVEDDAPIEPSVFGTAPVMMKR